MPEHRVLRVPVAAVARPVDGARDKRADTEKRHSGRRPRPDAGARSGVRPGREPLHIRHAGAAELHRVLPGRHGHRDLLSLAVPRNVFQVQEKPVRGDRERRAETVRHLSPVRRVFVRHERGEREVTKEVRTRGRRTVSLDIFLSECFEFETRTRLETQKTKFSPSIVPYYAAP